MSEAVIPEGQDQSAGVETAEAPAEQSERTFTQADLNKIAANEKRSGAKSGREAAISELLQKVGAESLDDVLNAYEEYQTVQQVTETEADKARKRAEKFEARAKDAESRYTNTLREYAVRDALRDEGINAARLPLALKVADMSGLDMGENGVEGVEDVVAALKEASPEWFAKQRTNAPETTAPGDRTPRGLQAQINEAESAGNYKLSIALKDKLDRER
jgi:predicted N-acetyltransferase YhbS